jgi:ribonuclease III
MFDTDKIKSQLKIVFNNNALLSQSFIHRSYLNESKKTIESNERLEFLGDSILSFVVSEYLYEKYPDAPEGELTNFRSSIVKTSSLALISKKLNLGEYLSLSRGEEESGGRNNPSILADTLEALFGAIFLDQGLENVKKVICENLIEALLPKILNDKSYKDAKSSFQEKVQEKIKSSPLYKVIKEDGPDHAKIFTVAVLVEGKVIASGSGRNKQEAEQTAANKALENWMK